MTNSTANSSLEIAVDECELRPTLSCLRSFCAKYAETAIADELYQFTFASHPDAEATFIHKSRLLNVGGPLAALSKPGFVESKTHTVELSQEDDPATFAIVRSFLYCDVIRLKEKTLRQILQAVQSAARWQLSDLVNALSRFIGVKEMIVSAKDVLACPALLELPDVSREFCDYFWRSAAAHFDEFGSKCCSGDTNGSDTDCSKDTDGSDTDCSGDTDEEEGKVAPPQESSVEVLLCPGFPKIWDMALSQERIVRFTFDVKRMSARNIVDDLFKLLMEYLEPQILDDNVMRALIDMLILDSDIRERGSALERNLNVKKLSKRALTLLLTSLLAPRNAGSAMSWEWDVCLLRPGSMETSFLFGPLHMSSDSWSKFARFDPSKSVSNRGRPSAQGMMFSVKATRKVDEVIEVIISTDKGDEFVEVCREKMVFIDCCIYEGHCGCSCCESGDPPDYSRLLHTIETIEISHNSKGRVELEVPKSVVKEFDERHDKEKNCMFNFRLSVYKTRMLHSLRSEDPGK